MYILYGEYMYREVEDIAVVGTVFGPQYSTERPLLSV